MESTTAITRNCAIAAGSRGMMQTFAPILCAAGQDRPHAPGPVVLPTCCAAGQLPAGCPTLPARHSGSVAGPVVLPGQDRPHAPGPVVLPTCCPWCCAAGQLPAGCPTLPAGHSGKRCRPVVLPVKIGPTLPAPWCCRRAALPAGCRRAARGAALPVNSRPVAPRSRPVTRGSVAGPWCCPVKIGPTLPARGAADVLRAPGRLPTCCPWCCAAGQLPAGCPTLPAGHSGKRCRPVVLPVKIGPTLPAPWCCRRAALPAGCRRAARGAALPVNSRPVAPRSRPVTRGSVAGPWCCPVKIGPTLPARGAADVPLPAGCHVLPVVLRCRSTPGRLPPRSRPVTREALPARGAARSRSAPRSRPVVLPTCRAYRLRRS